MKKSTEQKTQDGKENNISEATQFDILSKKIICMFHRNSLFTRLCCTDYEGRIYGQGDAVRMVDHTMLLIDEAVILDEERDLSIFYDDGYEINIVAARIAKKMQEIVEKQILSKAVGSQGSKLYFVCQIVPTGGFDPKGYGMKFVYGFKIG